MEFYHFIVKKLFQVGLILLLSALPALASYFLIPIPPLAEEGEIAWMQVRDLDKEIVWVDARDKDHFEVEHVPRAIMINSENIDVGMEHLFNRFSEGKVIIVYCEPDCYASHKVANRARELGLAPVYVLRGGFAEWKKFNR